MSLIFSCLDCFVAKNAPRKDDYREWLTVTV